ncbi:MAG: CPBP family intramembrane glutamic endopeptidase [Elusimicrobiota bacterium]
MTEREPWGFWATCGLGLCVAFAFVLCQAAVMGVFLGAELLQDPGIEATAYLAELDTDGFFIAVATCVCAAAGTALTVLFARLRGWTAGRYLALGGVERPVLAKWLVGTVAAVLAVDLLNAWFGRPLVPRFVEDAYATAVFPALFWFAFVVAAPVFEELFFRGFLYLGLQRALSRFAHADAGAVLLTSAAFGACHSRYRGADIVSALGLGLLLGAARWRTGSTRVTLAMHILVNGVSVVETAML